MNTFLSALSWGARPFVPLWDWLKRYHLDKLIITGGSMAVFIWAFTIFFGFWLSALFTFLLFVHEMGHVVALKWRGLQASSPIFIPFLGAVVIMKQQPKDADEEAFVGYGGPLFGSLAAFVVYGIWMAMPSHPVTLLLASMLATLLNLYNMAPIPPLDGGRITRGMGWWFKYLGFIFIAGFAVAFQSPAVVFLTLLVLVMSGGGMKAKHRLIFGIYCELLMLAMFVLKIGYSGSLAGALPLLLVSTYINVMIFMSYRKSLKLEKLVAERLVFYHTLEPKIGREMTAELFKRFPAASEAVVLGEESEFFTRAQKVKWMALYITLLAALIFCMGLQWAAVRALISG